MYFFSVKTHDGTAVKGKDYEELNKRITFTPNVKKQQVKSFRMDLFI